MRHMKGVVGSGGSGVIAAGPSGGFFSLADRRALFRNMMDPGVYWGDEFALRSLEAALGCRLCVVNEQFRVVKREHGGDEALAQPPLLPSAAGPDAPRGPFLGLLILAQAHYEPLAGPGGVLAWDMNDLPGPLARLTAQWLG